MQPLPTFTRSSGDVTREIVSSSVFFLACDWGTLQGVVDLITAGADINGADPCGKTPLHFAAAHRNRKEGPEIVRELLSRGVDVDAVATDGNTPLHVACETGSAGSVCALIAPGANVNATGIERSTPLHKVARLRDPTVACVIVRELLSLGADINAQREGGRSAIADACSFGCVQVVRALLDAGADVGSPHNRSLLHHAALQRDPDVAKEIVAELITHGVEADKLDV